MSDSPIPMFLACPACGERHIDEGEFATKPHHTHSCQGCGLTWRPAIMPTVGVQFLPGFKNESKPPEPSDVERAAEAYALAYDAVVLACDSDEEEQLRLSRALTAAEARYLALTRTALN